MAKEHCVTVTISSTSGGVVNQNVILEEYASTVEELVWKNHAVADAVIVALNNCMKELSGAFLKGEQPDGQKPAAKKK
jgi:hypothetical protein